MAKKGRIRAGFRWLIKQMPWPLRIVVAISLLVPVVFGAVLIWPSISTDVGGCKKIATFTLSEGEQKGFSLKDGSQLVVRADTVVGPPIKSKRSSGIGRNFVSGTWTIGSNGGPFSLRETDSATIGLARISSSSYSSSTGKPSSVRLRLGDCTSPQGTK
jgi:hypothetical protein